ncbi:MAG: phosphoglycerate dehydrogenase, partial [Betaproteobacteria bacterium]|nr:phosphoglycerate dehydrogenase [Betaproteobacteria bacterium]
LLHCARGGIVDEKALASALAGKKIAGAAIDVFASEPPDSDNPLLAAPNTVFTPHLGASTHEAQAATGAAIANQMVTFFATGEAINAVNIPRFGQHELIKAQPYCELARILGKIMAAAVGSKIKQVSLQLEGDAAELSEVLLLNAALIGILEDSFATPINQVNAVRVADNHGIKCEATKKMRASGFAGLVSLQVSVGRQTRSVAGTLLGGKAPHLVRLDDCALETPLSGHVLITKHDDRPGVVAKIAAQLARQRLNITNMHVGQSSRSGRAAALIGISKPLPDATHKAISRIAEVGEILSIKF